MSAAQTERVPIEAGFFTIPASGKEAPRLLGSRCKACAETFFPRRQICASCLSDSTEDVLLGPRGTLYTYTYVHVPLLGSMRDQAGGYGVGQIDLPEGPRVQAVLCGDRDEFQIGMQMELELETLRRNEQGQDVVIFRFRPIASESLTDRPGA